VIDAFQRFVVRSDSLQKKFAVVRGAGAAILGHLQSVRGFYLRPRLWRGAEILVIAGLGAVSVVAILGVLSSDICLFRLALGYVMIEGQSSCRSLPQRHVFASPPKSQ
jgi:hypothetical protein